MKPNMRVFMMLAEVLTLLSVTAPWPELHQHARKAADDDSNKDQVKIIPNEYSSVARRAYATPYYGIKAGEKEFTFFVDWGICGGSLIHDDIVLTAAHCVNLVPDENVYVGAYLSQTITPGVEERKIESKRIHPNYAAESFDVMLLKLVSPSTLTPIELNKDPEQPQTNENVTAMGHGRTERGPFSRDLLKVTMPRVSDEDCKTAHPYDYLSESMLCAGFFEERGPDTCEGDSGGPLVEYRVDKEGNLAPSQVGVVSWGVSCGLPGLPGVYAKVSSVKGWIDDQICILSSKPPERCITGATFYGQLWIDKNDNYEIDESERNVVTGIDDAEVILYRRTKGQDGKQMTIRVKRRKVNKDGTWLIQLKKVLGGKYYVKVVLNDNDFRFLPVGGSDVNTKGRSIEMNVKKGERYEVNAAIHKSTGNRAKPPSYAVHANVGGTNYTDVFGTFWIGYKPFHYGMSYKRSDSIVINGTDKQGLYRSEQYFDSEKVGDLPMVFEFPIPRGEYHVRLHFAEIYKWAQREGARVFDVSIEDSTIWKNLDIFKEAGGGYTALVKETEVTVDDCLLTVEFNNVTGDPKLSAIGICTIMTVDFDTKADGTLLEPGLYVEYEWLEFGMVVSASGGVGELLPRLFDTSNPDPYEGYGDADLGAPNKACSPSGRGIGAGGAPGEPGENCDFLGNVLIIQEDIGNSCTDDNRRGGIIVFDFVQPVLAVYEMGFLDIDDEAAVMVTQMTSVGLAKTFFYLPIYGDNSKQTLKMNIEHVIQVKVIFEKSGAVTHIKFCRSDYDTITSIAKAQSQCPAAFENLPKNLNPVEGNDQKTSDKVHVMQERSVGVP